MTERYQTGDRKGTERWQTNKGVTDRWQKGDRKVTERWQTNTGGDRQLTDR